MLTQPLFADRDFTVYVCVELFQEPVILSDVVMVKEQSFVISVELYSTVAVVVTVGKAPIIPVSYTHLTLPTIA